MQGLIRTGRLVEHRTVDKVVIKMEAAQVLDQPRNQVMVVGEVLRGTWERTVALPEQIDQGEG